MKPVINFKVEGITFRFKINREFTKISDDSGVGKSFLCYALRTAINTSKDTGIYPVKDIDTGNNINTIVLDALELSKDDMVDILSAKNSLIIIDEADILFNTYTELSDIIIRNDSNVYVLIARSVINNLPFGYYDTARISKNTDKKELRVEYYS